ncbi:hypothetical protein P691DRAFT_807680, partial [Macrolepiota fuliginosa MF-IS2]
IYLVTIPELLTNSAVSGAQGSIRNKSLISVVRPSQVQTPVPGGILQLSYFDRSPYEFIASFLPEIPPGFPLASILQLPFTFLLRLGGAHQVYIAFEVNDRKPLDDMVEMVNNIDVADALSRIDLSMFDPQSSTPEPPSSEF